MNLEIQRPALHPSQRRIHDSRARFRVLACGRRWGKTRLGSLECCETAIQGGRAWWVAPSYKVAQVGWRLVHRLAAQVPGAEIRRGELGVVFPGGGEVYVRSADNPDSLRGEGLDLTVLDECAFIAEDAWQSALRPALSDRQGRAVFISTPKGRNWFWRMFQMAQSGADGWACWQLPTSDNPYIAPSEIEAARVDLPELTFEQEYLAVFLEGSGTVFRNIAPNLYRHDETAHDVNHHVVAGVDWGKQADYTAISIGCRDCRRELVHDRFNKIDYSFQRGRLETLLKRWRVKFVLAESNAMGAPIIEQLQRDNLPVVGFETTSASKTPLIENMALALERNEWRWLDDAIWTGELEAYERKTSPTTGRSQYSAPDGMHDDTVIARCLMLRAAGKAAPAGVQPEQSGRFAMDEPAGSRWRV